MTAKKPAPVSPAKKPRGTKVLLEEQFREDGRKIRELEKGLDVYPRERAAFLREMAIIKFGGITPEMEEWIESLVIADYKADIERAFKEIRGYVGHDHTAPIPAKYLGRALSDIGAVDVPSSKNRIEIFASFHGGPAGDYLATLTPIKVDYRVCAKECHELLLLRRAGKKPLKGAGEKSKKYVSDALETPVVRLENLTLAESTPTAGSKRRDSTFLRTIGQRVFDGWPAWPSEMPGGPST